MDPGLLRLPNELVAQVTSHLTNIDIKSLRLTCKAMEERAVPWMERVFLSANKRDVDAFQGIAGHETWRHKVKEIIWDDAQMEDASEQSSDGSSKADEKGPVLSKKCPAWFESACRETLATFSSARQRGKEDLPLDDCWKHYKSLLEQQQEVLETTADAEAFIYGLQQFLSLKRVTITPAAHGLLDAPIYPTPTIRAFPDGFTYPIPRGWPLMRFPSHLFGDNTNNRNELKKILQATQERKKWRGFAYMMEVLAAHENGGRVVELVMDTHHLPTGISNHIFDQRCEAYDDLVTVLRRPGFRRLDLALLSEGLYEGGTDWTFFRSGLLTQALKAATDLEHFSLSIQIETCTGSFLSDGESLIAQYTKHYSPLRSIFPVDRWPQLRHFGVARILVQLDDMIDLLKALPPTIQSVELSFLQFLGARGSYRELLADMRNKLRWHERAADKQPRVIIHFNMPLHQMLYGYVCMDDDVNAFLYDDGANPFDILFDQPLGNMNVMRFVFGRAPTTL